MLKISLEASDAGQMTKLMTEVAEILATRLCEKMLVIQGTCVFGEYEIERSRV